MRRSALAGLLALVCGAPAFAQTLHFGERETLVLDAGTVDAGFVREELNVEDGGVATDGGVLSGLVVGKLLVQSPVSYPPELLEKRPSGVVQLALVIDENGEVDQVTLVQGADPLMNERALEAATKLVFEPTRLNGQPVSIQLTYSYEFVPPEQPAAVVHKTGFIEGHVIAKGTKLPVAGATVRSDHDPSRTVETDADGAFRLEVPRGYQFLIVSAPGYLEGSFREGVSVGETVQVRYLIEPEVASRYETTVVGEAERAEVTRVTLTDQELREVPGTMGDPFRVILLLPGVGTLASGIGFPIVRGSEPAATGYFIDGVKIPLLFHLGLGPAVIHPDFLEAINFYPGNAPLNYGRLLGGVIDARSAHTRDDRIHATAYADLFNAGGFAEVPIKKTATNITVSGRYSYTGWATTTAVNLFVPEPPAPAVNPRVVFNFWDYQARIEQKAGPGRLRLFVFGSGDQLGIDGSDPNSISGSALEGVFFHRVDLRYLMPLYGGEAEFGATFGKDWLDTFSGIGGGNPNSIDVRIGQTSLSSRVRYRRELQPKLELQAGADVERDESGLTTTTRVTPPTGGATTEVSYTQPTDVGTFVDGYVQFVNEQHDKLIFTPGVRFDNFHLVPGFNTFTLDPRISARYKLRDDLTLKGGAGMFHQAPTLLLSLPVVDLHGVRYGIQEALQFDVGAEWRPIHALDVNVDVYYNPIVRSRELNFFDLTRNSPGRQEVPENNTDPFARLYSDTQGYSYGFELLVRHPLGDNWFGWISYSLSRAARYEEFNRYNAHGQIIATYKDFLPFMFDQTHIFNGVISRKFAHGWTVGFVVHFNTGRPEYPVSNTQVPGYDKNGLARWIPLDADKSDRLPPFFRIDGRVQKSFVFDQFTLEAYLDFLNVSISKEIVAWSYASWPPAYIPSSSWSYVKDPQGFPIAMPILGLKATY